jgi:regulatory protein
LAYRFLARRAHSEEELAARLRRHGVSGAGIAATIDELKRQGYLDDAATAAQWARSWRGSKGWGPLRVRAELIRRGLDRRLAERVLAEVCPDDETEASAMQIAVRLARRPAFAGTGPRVALRLAAHLSRRGFPSDLARRVASHCCQAGDDVNIDHDD